jgi:KamA family protein
LKQLDHRSRRPPRRLRVTSGPRLRDLPQVASLPPALRRDIRVVSRVLPFRVNNYVVEELIDWSAVPDDPLYRMLFPHRDMLDPADYARIAGLLDRRAPPAEVRAAADEIRLRLNPHPAGQLEKNVPVLDGRRLHGLQHKYRETVLFFPSQGQTCHSYCAYCFRWAQFVGMEGLRQACGEAGTLTDYLRAHPEVTDVLFTGGDPMILSTRRLEAYIRPLLAPDMEHVQTIRLGTKALAYWPYRFTSDADAPDLLRLVEECVQHGKHVAVMAHFTHPRELMTNVALRAIAKLRAAGATIRTQAPLVRHVNDDPAVWAEMWREQVRAGCVPYYMFVERDTGAQRYFGLPLARALEVYDGAYRRVSGLARTARGPSLSADPGKVCVDGVSELAGERVFHLRFLQARDPAWVGRPFFAAYDDEAQWLGDLAPAFGADRFFFEEALDGGGPRSRAVQGSG